MTIIQLQQTLRSAVQATAASIFNVELDQIAVEIPPKTELGDLAFPTAFELAKRIKQATGEKANPRNIAETLKTSLEQIDLVDRVEVAGAGYLNVFFDRSKILAAAISDTRASKDPSTAQKVCVEHTSVNPNKAAHIGHVRNAVLGDTFHRILKATGKQVEVQFYIDNTGVQVADVVVGFIYLEEKNLEDIKVLDQQLRAEGNSFDYYCWDLYSRVGKYYEANEQLKEKRAEILHLIEEGGNPTAELADFVATRNVHCIVDTMERLGIRYDLLPRESEILHLQFWNRAFEQMKERGAIHFEAEGKNTGCWVMPFEAHSGTDEHDSDKILVRSNGTVTYTGKDIAYQLWKLGTLGLDFNYKRFHQYPNGEQVWTTTAVESENDPSHPDFGGGSAIFNVIDSRQSYPQEIVKKGVAAIYPEMGEQASVHLSYEMVALSPAAAEELGFALSAEERTKPFIEMSGRKGLGVKADDLIDRLDNNALAEVESRHPEIADAEKRIIAHQIAVGALRYFLLKFTRNTVIVFDFKEALSFEGETGCFCQYAAVRANSIFRKLDEAGESVLEILRPLSDPANTSELLRAQGSTDVWALLTLALRLPDVVRQAAAQNEPAILAKYTFNLAKSFNLFYHNHKILPEKDPTKRAVLIAVADVVRSNLTESLGLLGIEVPPKM